VKDFKNKIAVVTGAAQSATKCSPPFAMNASIF
jgi:hypothetical protein